MSTINVRPSRDAAGAVAYVLYGHAPDRRQRLIEARSTRAAAFAMSMANGGATPGDFIERSEAVARSHGRTNELQSYVLAFHPEEFDVSSQQDMERIRDVAVKLAERMHSADYLVVVHNDAAGGHGHAHILVTNHDNLTGKSLQRYTSWRNGLRQLNDDLMREEGLRVLPSPELPKPDWELRREEFAADGFEQTLGDKVYASLEDPRSVDRAAFEQVLDEHGITLAVTDRDGWSYKMRRTDNGKVGRKKASRLAAEFTADGAQKIFDIHAQYAQKAGHHGTGRQAPAGAVDYGDVGRLDLNSPRRRAAADVAHHSSAGAAGGDLEQCAGELQAARGHGAAALGIDHAALRSHVQGLAVDREHREQAERDRADARRVRQRSRRQRDLYSDRGDPEVDDRAREDDGPAF